MVPFASPSADPPPPYLTLNGIFFQCGSPRTLSSVRIVPGKTEADLHLLMLLATQQDQRLQLFMLASLQVKSHSGY